MKRLILFILALCIISSLQAQLVNQGGTIIVDSGATLILENGITNAQGSITNNGTIKTKGNFINNATVNSGAGSKLVFEGSTSSNFNAGGSNFAVLENAKTAGDVILTSNAKITEQVNFSGTSDINLDNYNLTLAETATTNGKTEGHFVSNAVGMLQREVSSAGTAVFDLGDGTNFSPLSTTHSGTYASSVISAQVNTGAHPDRPTDATDFINRYWTVQNNISSPSISMTGTYVAADMTGTQDLIKGARLEAANWEYATGASTANTVTATTTASNSELAGHNLYSDATFKVFLQGPYLSGGTMRTVYYDNNLLPLTSPYDASVTVSAIPAGTVDWIELEFRDPTVNTTVLTKKSAFLKSDGSVVDTQGNTVSLKDFTNAFVVVRHRTHLAAMTGTAIDFATNGFVNIGDGTVALYENGSSYAPAKTLSDGKIALYAGNASGDLNINGLDDLAYWRSNNGTFVANASEYDTNKAKGDYNLDRNINGLDKLAHWLGNNGYSSQVPQN